MDGYGRVAIRAAELVVTRTCPSPVAAWVTAAHEVFSHSTSQQAKSCPKGAFLGLCEEGLVSGVPSGRYTESRDNKAYAVRAAALLAHDPNLANDGPTRLWNAVLVGHRKRHNSQMNVVLALYRSGLLCRPPTA